jgi:hypothetical protein
MDRHAVRAFVVVGALVTGALLSSCGSDGSDGAKASSTTAAPTTTTEATTTTAGATTSTTEAPSTEQPETAVWPFASSDDRFDDPVAAATSFATDYLGFVDPVVGEFQQGDTRSGEVSIKAKEQGPVTTIFVRQVTSDDTWWVLGAATDSLRLESPEALASITSPVTLSGQSTAFEATINIEIRQDGSLEPLAEDIAMGGANGEMGPFSKELAFDAPSAARGAVILKTYSAEDGSIMEAGVLRVAFGS